MDADSGRHSSKFPVELFERIENGFADLDERWTDPHRTPVAQSAFANLAAITFDNLIERQEYWVGHVSAAAGGPELNDQPGSCRRATVVALGGLTPSVLPFG